jgi:hypothetical protein
MSTCDDDEPRGSKGTSTSEDSFSLMRTFMEKQFNALKRELRDEVQTSSELSYKRFKVRNSHDFKFKGNKMQHGFNVEIQDDLDIASDCIRNGDQERSLEQLNLVKTKIDKRNKLVKLADKSPGGWGTVQEYCSDDLASDSEDDKKIRRAENRALAKRKKKSTPSATVTSGAYNGGQAMSSWPISERSQRSFRPVRNVNVQCFGCGGWGHLRPECPMPRDAPGAGGSSRFNAGFRPRQFEAMFPTQQQQQPKQELQLRPPVGT